MLDIDGGQFLAGWTVTDVWRVRSVDEKASCSLMDEVLVGYLILATRTSLSRSSSDRRAGQLEEGRRQVEFDGLARRRPTCKLTDGLALFVHRRAGDPPPGRTHPALSVSFRQVLVLLSVTRTARRPSGQAGCVQRWHRQPEEFPQIDQMDTRSQRHSGMSHSCFLVPELGFIECQVHPSSTKNSFQDDTNWSRF